MVFPKKHLHWQWIFLDFPMVFPQKNLHWLWIFLDFPMVFPFKPPLTVDFPQFSHGFPNKKNLHWFPWDFPLPRWTPGKPTALGSRPRNRRSWTKRFCHVGRWAPRTRQTPGENQIRNFHHGGQINGRSSGSNWWRYVNVPYFWPYFLVIFTEI